MIRAHAIPFVKNALAQVKFEDVAKLADATAKLAVVADKHVGKVVPVAKYLAKAVGIGRTAEPTDVVNLVPDVAFDPAPLADAAGTWDFLGGIDYSALDTFSGGW